MYTVIRGRFIDAGCFLQHEFFTALNSECWTQTNDVQGVNGIAFEAKNIGDCQRACVNTIACVALDWEPRNGVQSCWILSSTFTRPATENGVITHYELNRSCIG